MKIAQVAPLYESVPPRAYGGTERVVSYLTEELHRMGHQVTLFASADSRTRACLEPQAPRALRLDASCLDPVPEHVLMLEAVFARAEEFDVIHFHTEALHFPLGARARAPTVTTLHGRLDLPHIERLYRAFKHLRFISISDAQRRPMPWLNWQRTIHHGLPADDYRYVDQPQGYLAFVGRISPEKRVDRAIEIARRAGVPLRIAAKIDQTERGYFETQIRGLLRQPGVEYLGELCEEEKRSLVAHATALLFPIDWPEPFGLVMIEAMACGTPVIAFPRGSVTEVIEDGLTGFLVDSIDDAVRAVEQVETISREQCRAQFEARFTARRMAEDHVDTYALITEGSHAAHAQPDGRSDRRRTGSLLRPSSLRLPG